MQGRYCSSSVNFLIEMQEFLNNDLMHLVLDLVVQVLVNDHTASASEIVSVHLFLLLAFTAQGWCSCRFWRHWIRFTWDLDSSEVLTEIFPEGFMIPVWEQLHLSLYERSSSQNWWWPVNASPCGVHDMGGQVAAALHDNCRALLVGRRTFGKVGFKDCSFRQPIPRFISWCWPTLSKDGTYLKGRFEVYI